jgi:hypothetical protein
VAQTDKGLGWQLRLGYLAGQQLGGLIHGLIGQAASRRGVVQSIPGRQEVTCPAMRAVLVYNAAQADMCGLVQWWGMPSCPTSSSGAG